MHFLLLGATGRTGKHVVSEILSQGHTAVALVRTAGTFTPHPGLTIVTGSPLAKDDVRKAVSATPWKPSAAINTLNSVRKSDNLFAAQVSPPRFLADSSANACEVLEEAGIPRIVVMSAAGVGDSWAKLPWLTKIFLTWTNIKYAIGDHNLVDQEIRQTKMDWTLVRAVKLDYDDPKPNSTNTGDLKLLGGDGEGLRGPETVSAANVAKFLVKVATERLFVKDAVVVTN